MNNLKREILSYYELRKLIDQSKCILNNETLDYLESLLGLEISALQENRNDFLKCEYLKQLELFKSLVLYNIYKNSLKLVNDDIVVSDKYNRLNFLVKYKDVNFSIYSFDYNDIPNIYLYRKNLDISSLNLNQSDFIVPYAREVILEKFLSRNDLNLSDFDDERGLNGIDHKVKKYGYGNVYIK